MEKVRLFTMFSAFALAAAGALGLANLKESNQAESAEAATYSGSIYIQKNDNDAKWDGCNLVGYLFDGSNSVWGSVVSNTSNTYQEYSWSLSFNPTTIIMLRVPTNWSSSWDNPWWDGSGGIYARTGNVTLASNDVIWMAGNATKDSNWGSYSMETFVMSNSDAKIGELSEKKITSGNEGLEVFGEISLAANQQFYIKKTSDGATKYNTYTCLSQISSNLSKVGDYIKVTQAASYEFYFNFNANTLYLTDPVVAAADEWAQAFLANVGCDPTGAALPSGWAGEVTRFNSITDSRVKDKIYSAVGNKSGSYLEKAVYWYDYAVAAHPSLTKFIVNSSSQTRGANVGISPLAIVSSDSNIVIAIVIISLVSVTAIGGYFFIKKRKSI